MRMISLHLNLCVIYYWRVCIHIRFIIHLEFFFFFLLLFLCPIVTDGNEGTDTSVETRATKQHGDLWDADGHDTSRGWSAISAATIHQQVTCSRSCGECLDVLWIHLDLYHNLYQFVIDKYIYIYIYIFWRIIQWYYIRRIISFPTDELI